MLFPLNVAYHCYRFSSSFSVLDVIYFERDICLSLVVGLVVFLVGMKPMLPNSQDSLPHGMDMGTGYSTYTRCGRGRLSQNAFSGDIHTIYHLCYTYVG